MPVKWTPGAKADVLNLVAYISQDRPDAARRMAAKLRAAASSLRGLPEMGRMVPEFDEPSIRELVVRPYRLVYRVKEEFVDILAVVHSRRAMTEALVEQVE